MLARILGYAVFVLLLAAAGLLWAFGAPRFKTAEDVSLPAITLQEAIAHGYGEEKARSLIALERISLERKACFGDCPVYKVVFFRDGRAEYEGKSFAPREGRFAGRIWWIDFARLAQLADHARFFSLPHEYFSGATDQPTAIVEGVAGARKQTISEDGDVGPVELWALQQAIDSVASRVDWKPVEVANATH